MPTSNSTRKSSQSQTGNAVNNVNASAVTLGALALDPILFSGAIDYPVGLIPDSLRRIAELTRTMHDETALTPRQRKLLSKIHLECLNIWGGLLYGAEEVLFIN